MNPAAAAQARAERFRALLATLAAEPAYEADGAPTTAASASADAATMPSGTAAARHAFSPPCPAGHRRHSTRSRWLLATSACAAVVVGGWAALGSARSPGADPAPTTPPKPAPADAVVAVPAPAQPVPELPGAPAPCAAVAAALGLCSHLLK